MNNIKISSLSNEGSKMAKISFGYDIFAGVMSILANFAIIYVYDKYVEQINHYFVYNFLVIIVGIIYYIIVIVFIRTTDNSTFFVMPDLIQVYISQVLFLCSGVIVILYELDPQLFFFLTNSILHFAGVSFLSSAYFKKNRLYSTTLQKDGSEIILNHVINYPIIGYHIKHKFSKVFSKNEKLKIIILKSVSRRLNRSAAVILKYRFISNEELVAINQDMDSKDIKSNFIVYFLLDENNNLPSYVTGLLVKGRISLNEVNNLLRLFSSMIDVDIVQIGDTARFTFDLISFKIQIKQN